MFKIQFNYNDHLRIVAPDGTAGEWTHYTGIAILVHGGKTYIAATEYGLLPKAETVYTLGDCAETELDRSFEYIDASGIDHRSECLSP